jgi:hypothetical protein
LAIVGCFYPPTTGTTINALPPATGTTGTPSPISTPTPPGTPSASTTTFPPTTTTMNYCAEEKGMNQPLNITPSQVASSPLPDQITPAGDINPTSTKPGLNFPSTTPQINITFDQPATITVIYLPVDRPNQPTNVDEFVVVFVYPNGTTSDQFTSEIPSTVETTTTTTPSGLPSETTTTPSTSGLVPPSDVSPQVDLPPNFHVPQGTKVMITITSTKDELNPFGVCIILLP